MEAVTSRRRIGTLAVVAIVVVVWALSARAQRVSEYQVKAAFLYSFAKFVEWPDQTSATEFELCILGDDPFGPLIDAVAAARLKDKPLVVRRIRRIEEADGCHTLFVGDSEAGRAQALVEALRTTPVLTVSDIPQFAQQGGMIGFTIVAGRVRFVANPAAARSAGLHLTSDLLRVAVAIVGHSMPKE
jgi:hypothetical protein